MSNASDIQAIRDLEAWRANRVSQSRDYSVDAYVEYSRALDNEAALEAIHEIAAAEHGSLNQHAIALHRIAELSDQSEETP